MAHCLHPLILTQKVEVLNLWETDWRPLLCWPLPGDEVDVVPDSSLVFGPVLWWRVAPRTLRLGGERIGQAAPTHQQTDAESCKHDPWSLRVGHLRRNTPRFRGGKVEQTFCCNQKSSNRWWREFKQAFNRRAKRIFQKVCNVFSSLSKRAADSLSPVYQPVPSLLCCAWCCVLLVGWFYTLRRTLDHTSSIPAISFTGRSGLILTHSLFGHQGGIRVNIIIPYYKKKKHLFI